MVVRSFFYPYALISCPFLKVNRTSSLLWMVMKSTSPHQRAVSKAAAKAAAQESTEVMAVEAAEPEIEAAPEESPQDSKIPAQDPGESATEENEPEGIEAAYNVTGVRRKQLVVAVSEFTNAKPEYKAAPSFAYEIGKYTVDKEGTLIGPENPALIESLKEQGFIAAE